MAKTDIPDITVREAEVRYLNFEGRATMYKEAGNRSFQLILPEDVADDMAKQGWNVKMTNPRRDATDEERESFEPRPYIEVAVSYKYDEMAPKVVLVTDSVQTLLNADTAFLVDQADIIRFDCVINASRWEVGSKSGIKAYLKKAYITIQEDDLDSEYSHIPIAGTTKL